MRDVSRLDYVLFLAMALALNIPLVLGSVQGIDICISLLLAPAVAWYGWKSLRDKTVRIEMVLFVLALLGGLTSCLVWQWRAPDGELLRHIASLAMIFYCIAFMFAGWQIAKVLTIQQCLMVLATSAASFLIIVAAPHIVWSTRVWVTPNEQAQLNVTFLNFKLFGTFGVLSLAHLWCIQTGLSIAGMVALRERVLRSICAVGFAAGIFLLLSSESRGAQLCAAGFIGCLLLFIAKRHCAYRLLILLVAACAVVAVSYVAQVPHNGTRLGRSIDALNNLRRDVRMPATEAENRFDMLILLTGRDYLITSALADIRANPIVGTGFSGVMRLNEPTYARPSSNSSTHIYYLTLLWKGGMVFAVPIFALILVQWWKLWQRRGVLLSAEYFFVTMAVAIVFGFLAFTWDILMVPSAGAFSYLLLGLLARAKQA